jgi:hypothetical protein
LLFLAGPGDFYCWPKWFLRWVPKSKKSYCFYRNVLSFLIVIQILLHSKMLANLWKFVVFRRPSAHVHMPVVAKPDREWGKGVTFHQKSFPAVDHGDLWTNQHMTPVQYK